MNTVCAPSIPQELNWVKVRAACSIERVFAKLVQDVEDDVKEANTLPRWPHHGEIQAGSNRDGTIYIVRRIDPINKKVTFGRSNERIEVIDEVGNQKISVSLTINDEGRCVMKMEDGREIEQWQLRKAALEALFFDNPSL